MAWGSSFDKKDAITNYKLTDTATMSEPLIGWAADAKLLNDVLTRDGAIGWPDTLLYGTSFTKVTVEDDGIKRVPIRAEKVYNNVQPTHDPYTNPNAHIYYECNCGQMLDPGTKRFAELNNCASREGWKIRFSDNGYVPYCVECGKGVE